MKCREYKMKMKLNVNNIMHIKDSKLTRFILKSFYVLKLSIFRKEELNTINSQQYRKLLRIKNFMKSK